MRPSFFTLALLLGTCAATAQDLKDQDRSAILDMCGCYEVDFRYTETFSPDPDYEKHPDYQASGLEWVTPIEARDNYISLQHLLLVGGQNVIKHWRQDWEYESLAPFEYTGPSTWQVPQPAATPVRGSWTQKVYQVDDSPRYAGTATWIHEDGRHYWEDKAPSPLPRREYTKRSDYDLMVRGNRHEITDSGWVHEQDNEKIRQDTETGRTLIAEEKGRNTYRKVDDTRCLAAAQWWEDHKAFWAGVRQAWDQVLRQPGQLVLRRQVDGKPLHEHMGALEARNASQTEIEAVIRSFVDSRTDGGQTGR
ncbi:DUF6607 family protein [Robiginitalea sediminis]|uniref:DUF6607 family protein n=1 Tax=Robiginitalea sediminis TaxID=1982593 RepID=UPI000B4B3AF7|nr:DUF6607 family protein [Robiginitalea sediminis]